ncbi:hypothetical protein PC9H_011333 [Pleurotus ostreatus]|uniref:BTB domain-containing protein n=1 Tax=Pleurotus ostreatus TaxID=5322 RepID=A0A8H6ZLM5_PLEOS|nr:uncharacterized protein PC9H_011333 [Pleurotus ostreatus]KAF7420815.1 hypothetical protein PC9H_011333 [Pleurotus ostreatus]
MSAPTPMRDKSFDFSDGDVLLSAPGNAGDDEAIAVDAEASYSNITPVYSQTPAAVVYFRIHKALLTGHPSMFTDMFEVVNPSLSEQNLYDGVPLIALYDGGSHVRGFLRVLSQPETVFLPRYHHPSAELLMGPPLLAIKYQADAIRDVIVLHPRADWPISSYAAWKKRQWQEPKASPADRLRIQSHSSISSERRTPPSYSESILRWPFTRYYPAGLLPGGPIYSTQKTSTPSWCCTINAWLITWIKEDPSTYYFYGRKAQGRPRLEIRPSECSCKLKEFKDEVLLDWMEHSLDHVDVIEYLEHLAVIVEANRYRWRFCNRNNCRSKAAPWIKEMARMFYDRMEEIIFPSHAQTGN